jgi:hypothetical protein
MWRRLLAVVVGSVMAAVAAGGADCTYAGWPDINFSGNDLPGQPASTTLTSPDECAALCCAASGCTAFTLNGGAPGARMCFLKLSSAVHNANPGASSGVLGPPPPPPASCALDNGTACAAAPWPAAWSLRASSTCYPNHETGYFVPPPGQPWGLLPVSWTNAMDIWKAPDDFNSTCEAAMREGCRRIKAVDNTTRCFRYNNMELALAFLESNRAVMDADHADWFLQYVDPATGAKNGTVYVEGSGWFWDYRVPAVRAHVLAMVLNGTVGDAVFDGTFTDDEIGFPVEHESAPAAMGMNASAVADVRHWAQVTSGVVIAALHGAGKYAFQAFFNGTFDGGNVGPAPTAATCAPFMREYCDARFQNVSFTMRLDTAAVNVTLAAFLVTRGPIAYVGFGWASGQETWRPEFLWDVGVPRGLCAEVAPGVFSRAWTHGNATVDCNTWTGTVPAA